MKRILMILVILFAGLLVISTVGAADNVTDDVSSVNEDLISADDCDDVISASQNQDEDSLQVNSDDDIIVSSNNSNVIQSESKNVKKVTNEPKGGFGPGKVKTVKMKVKNKWKTKKVGPYKIKARIWKMYGYAMGHYYYVDIMLLWHGQQVSSSYYLSKYKYKKNGKWRWWKTWRHGGVDHAYHRYANNAKIGAIKVKFIP